MLHSHFHYHLLFPITTHHHYPSFSSSPSSSPPLVHFLHHRPKNKNIHSPHTTVVSAIPSWITQLTTTVTEDPSAIQVSSSVLLTTAITVFVFPSLQRRIKKAKQLKYRSSGVNKSLDSSKASIKAKNPPSADQALLGAIIAGVIAVFIYRFTTSIEAALYRQTLSDNFSVRQITITIRTIINGLCYLATFVYGINSVGLLLYSGQLAINTFTKETESKIIENLNTSNNLNITKEDQGSNNSQ